MLPIFFILTPFLEIVSPDTSFTTFPDSTLTGPYYKSETCQIHCTLHIVYYKFTIPNNMDQYLTTNSNTLTRLSLHTVDVEGVGVDTVLRLLLGDFEDVPVEILVDLLVETLLLILDDEVGGFVVVVVGVETDDNELLLIVLDVGDVIVDCF
jgi:hypothetical protein